MASTDGNLEENETSKISGSDNNGALADAENSVVCSASLPPPTSNNKAGENESETKEPTMAGEEAESKDGGEPNEDQTMSEHSDSVINSNNEVQDNQTDSFEELKVELPSSDENASGDSRGGLKVELPPLDGATASTSSEKNNAETENGAKAKDLPDLESVYHIKWVNFKNQKVPIITQNENGPCPLLAIMNVLLLKKKVTLTQSVEFITANQVMAHLGNCVLENVPKEEASAGPARLNFEQNMQDAMAVMHKLQTGLDVNVRFTGVRDFEYTPECIIFDLLHISLYHGWLVDPQNQDEVDAVGKCSYNQLVEKIISHKTSEKPEEVRKALIAEEFLERAASQLTYHGLCELNSQVKDDELAVFFRNNHFTTLYRNKNELFQLVTDQGFLTESNVVWETLGNVEGDCHFVDSEFHTYTKPEPPPMVPVDTAGIQVNTDEQIDHDYLVALSLDQEQHMSEQQMGWGQIDPKQAPQISDLELAKQLQEEERQAAEREAAVAAERQQQRGPAQVAGGRGGNSSQRRPRERAHGEREEKKSDCCIL